MTAGSTFRELVYDESVRIYIQENWPDAVFTDASDEIHEGRFEVEIAGITEDEFYPVALAEGWFLSLLGGGLIALDNERKPDIERWIKLAKERMAPKEVP